MPRAQAFVSKAGGFTLVELLVAVVLLAVGALGAVTMQRTAVKANQATYANEVAHELAVERIGRSPRDAADRSIRS